MNKELIIATQIFLPKEELLLGLQKVLKDRSINLQKIAEEELAKINTEEIVRDEVQKVLIEYIRKEVTEDIADYSTIIENKIIRKALNNILEEI